MIHGTDGIDGDMLRKQFEAMPIEQLEEWLAQIEKVKTETGQVLAVMLKIEIKRKKGMKSPYKKRPKPE